MHTPELSQNMRARPWQSLEPPLLLRAPAAQGNHSLPLLPPAPPHYPIGAGRNQRREGSRRQTRRSDAAVEARPPPLLRRQCLRAMCHVTTLTYLRPLTNLARHTLTHLASRALTNLASPALTHPAILPYYPNCVRQSHRSPPVFPPASPRKATSGPNAPWLADDAAGAGALCSCECEPPLHDDKRCNNNHAPTCEELPRGEKGNQGEYSPP